MNTEKTHVVIIQKIDVEKTLRSFNVGDCELIPFTVSHTDTTSWSSRCNALKKLGRLSGKYKFIRVVEPAATVITRMS